jgi:hypothetical protein
LRGRVGQRQRKGQGEGTVVTASRSGRGAVLDGLATTHEDLGHEVAGSALRAPVISRRGALCRVDVEPVFVAAASRWGPSRGERVQRAPADARRSRLRPTSDVTEGILGSFRFAANGDIPRPRSRSSAPTITRVDRTAVERFTSQRRCRADRVAWDA